MKEHKLLNYIHYWWNNIAKQGEQKALMTILCIDGVTDVWYDELIGQDEVKALIDKDAKLLKETISKWLAFNVFDSDKTLNVLSYILMKFKNGINVNYLYQILYLADQVHLVKYERPITGDTYLAMYNGPVPSNVSDIINSLRGTSYFSLCEEAFKIKPHFRMVNNHTIAAITKPDMRYLCDSEIACIDEAVASCKDSLFSRGLAWYLTGKEQVISIKDIPCEAACENNYIEKLLHKSNKIMTLKQLLQRIDIENVLPIINKRYYNNESPFRSESGYREAYSELINTEITSYQDDEELLVCYPTYCGEVSEPTEEEMLAFGILLSMTLLANSKMKLYQDYKWI